MITLTLGILIGVIGMLIYVSIINLKDDEIGSLELNEAYREFVFEKLEQNPEYQLYWPLTPRELDEKDWQYISGFDIIGFVNYDYQFQVFILKRKKD